MPPTTGAFIYVSTSAIGLVVVEVGVIVVELQVKEYIFILMRSFPGTVLQVVLLNKFV